MSGVMDEGITLAEKWKTIPGRQEYQIEIPSDDPAADGFPVESCDVHKRMGESRLKFGSKSLMRSALRASASMGRTTRTGRGLNFRRSFATRRRSPGKSCTRAKAPRAICTESMNSWKPADFNDAYVMRNSATGEPLANTVIELTRGDGTGVKMVTDAAGKAPLQKTLFC